MDTNQRISSIIQGRGTVSAKVNAYREQWEARLEKAKALKTDLSELRQVCQHAMSGGQQDNRSAFQDLSAYLDEVEQEQLVRKLLASCSYASKQLGKLDQRFNRKTINIAVAGVGRCGKSTALKALIGQKQDDNSTIPSGNGPAITAGKSTICCVSTAEEEKTIVHFHTAQSFLTELVNPLLQSISLSEYQCDDIDEFSALKFDTLLHALEEKARQAQTRVREAEIAAHRDADNAEAKAKLDQANAYASSFNLYFECLYHIGDIIKEFRSFRMLLNGGTEAIPLNQTYRYVSYPKSGEPAYCYAVKECRIYSRFPNNEVQALELTDLPGLGTSSQSEKKCFLEGFNYAVDLALMIRRPEGLFQNFTTNEDLNVLNVLGATFGDDHLHECMLMLQNDANLQQADVESAFQRIEEWNGRRKHPVKVIRGNAVDSDFMQNTLLPEVLAFISENLPKMDQALVSEVLPSLDRMADDFDSALAAIVQKFSQFKRCFPSNRGTNAINDRTDRLRDQLMNEINVLMDHYGEEFENQNTSLADEIEKLTEKARLWVETQYDPHNQTQVEEVKNSIRATMSTIPFANRAIHAIRIHISEIFSELERIHVSLIDEMRHSVSLVLWKCFPNLLSETGGLEGFIDLADRSGECPEVIAAVRTLNELEVPFYNVIYPDLRKEVFDAMNQLERRFQFPEDKSQEQQAVMTLSELQSIGMNWIWKTEEMLHSQSKITEIICAALERFQDRMIRNNDTRREMVGFVEYFWGDIQNDSNAYSEDVRTKIEKLAK